MKGNLFFVTAVVFAAGILYRTLADVPLEFVALSMFFGAHVLVFWVFEKKTIFAVLGIVLVLFPLGIIRTSLVPSILPDTYKGMVGNPVSLAGTIIADPDLREKNQQLLVQVQDHGEKTNILVFAPLFQQFSYGERVLIAGTLTKPAPFQTDGGRIFRYDQFLAKKGVFSIVPEADLLEVSPPRGIQSLVLNILFGIKHTFVLGLQKALPDPFSALATGLLTGNQHGLDESIENNLILSGLIWIVVLSGYHVTLIAEAVLGLFNFLPRKSKYILAGVSIFGILIATGMSAPSLRGGLMAVLTLFAHATNRTYDALRALAASVILILMWNPYLLAYDSGFQLSLVVTPALLLATPILEHKLLFIKSAFVREILAVSIVAQLACLPLILWQTGNLGVWAVVANIFVMPLVPLSMLLAFIAGIFGVFLSPLAALAGMPAYVILLYVEKIAKIFASLPYAAASLPSFPFYCVVISYTILIGVAYLMKKNTRVAGVSVTRVSSKVYSPIQLRSKNASP